MKSPSSVRVVHQALRIMREVQERSYFDQMETHRKENWNETAGEFDRETYRNAALLVALRAAADHLAAHGTSISNLHRYHIAVERESPPMEEVILHTNDLQEARTWARERAAMTPPKTWITVWDAADNYIDVMIEGTFEAIDAPRPEGAHACRISMTTDTPTAS